MKTSRPSDYEVRRLASIEEFVETTLHWLKSDEEKNNSLIAVAQAIERGKPAYDGPKWFGCVERQSSIEGCLINTSLDGLLTSDLPAGAIAAVCDSLEEATVEVRKINGPSETIAKLADELCARSSCLSWRVSHQWQCYMLQRLIWPKRTAPGHLRHCTDDERETIRHWGELYGEEKPAPIPVPDFLLSKVDDQDLYVWDDDGAKMLLTISGRTKKSARISAVYTPK